MMMVCLLSTVASIPITGNRLIIGFSGMLHSIISHGGKADESFVNQPASLEE
jgi:hypothetical protein